MYTRKNIWKNMQGPQPECGQVGTWPHSGCGPCMFFHFKKTLITFLIQYTIHTISLNSYPCRSSEGSFTALATNMLHSCFYDTLIISKKYICNLQLLTRR